MSDDGDLKKYGIIPERPPSLDEEGHRKFIIPASVKGAYRNARNWFYGFLIGIFLIVPWTTFDGQQTILLDITQRKFTFFGTTFLAHDGPLVFFVLAISVFSIILATSLFGRVWCGWACPQTVFIDALFRRIEELVEGSHLKRRKLNSSPWNLKKASQKTLKWTLYFIVSSHIAHSFTAYFVGASELIWITLDSPFNNLDLFIFVQVFTFITLINFGWFREQFCLIVCPYGRFQSVLMDQSSLAILYDSERGEPRKAKGLAKFGDCVNCFRCVNVCPTGIDIRDGLQMECIACTACADACDEIMDKVGKPRGLIRYASEAELRKEPRSWITLRNITYASVLSLLIVGFSVSLAFRSQLEVKVVRALETPYKIVQGPKGEQVLNHFRIHITNQSESTHQLQGFTVDLKEAKVISPESTKQIKPGESLWIHAFIQFPQEVLRTVGRHPVTWTLHVQSQEKLSKSGTLTLVGP